MSTIPEQHIAFPDIATFRKIPSRALLMIAQAYHWVLDNLRQRPFREGGSFDFDSWYEALMHSAHGTAPGLDGERVDLLQQLV